MASQWAQEARPGDTIDVTVLVSNFTLPEPAPKGYVIVGDRIATRDRLTADRDRRRTRPGVPRSRARRRQAIARGSQRGRGVGGPKEQRRGRSWEAVTSSSFEATDHFGWVACDNRTTRAVAKVFRDDYKIPRKSIKAQAYWVA